MHSCLPPNETAAATTTVRRVSGLGNLAVSQPSCLLRVARQLGTESVLQLNDFFCKPERLVESQTVVASRSHMSSQICVYHYSAQSYRLLQHAIARISSIQFLHPSLHSRGRVKVYGKLSPEFTTSSDGRQGCPLLPFLFNFVIDTIMEDSLPASKVCGIEVPPGRLLTDIE
ncbi:hypothetical protein T265_09458 [Opisthorchis viverrini]|uniref:Reverse transcriptase domain-containing protein n=1 Tax=Opisthorchis viverrini TaxID=6198 RepID=A0A074Z5N0_OPIVI|nr:hypothetical protein T265_09458 [Opisthorchis viverrini]KER22441.1 hypothetical protein T265_09458 [Opisthorchis viverrini]